MTSELPVYWTDVFLSRKAIISKKLIADSEIDPTHYAYARAELECIRAATAKSWRAWHMVRQPEETVNEDMLIEVRCFESPVFARVHVIQRAYLRCVPPVRKRPLMWDGKHVDGQLVLNDLFVSAR